MADACISRRAVLRATIPTIAGAAALPMAAEAAQSLPMDLDAIPVSALWPRAIELAHDLSLILDRLSDDGTLAVRVYAKNAGIARVNFSEAEPFHDARALVGYYQKRLVASVEAVEGQPLDWFDAEAVDDDANGLRFCLMGHHRKGAA